MNVAVFRPADERLDEAVTLLESLGTTPIPDPMLSVESTGSVPLEDADYTILTSKTGVELAAEVGWRPGETKLCAIGDATAAACSNAGWDVALIPDKYTSTGLVSELATVVEGASVEVARSNHGSPVLTDGLNDAGAFVHETVLYELIRPKNAGDSVDLAVTGKLDAALFSSSLTVEHWLAVAAERGNQDAALSGLNDAIVGCIGPPTRETATERGIEVDVVPPDADFEKLAKSVCSAF